MTQGQTDTLRVQIRNLAHGGAGVGTVVDSEDTRVCFVEGGLPGELVLATPTREAKRYREARLVSVVERSPDRVEPPCPSADRCGGCNFQHVTPEAAAELKQKIALEQLRKVLQRGVPIRPVVSLAPAAGYRRVARLHARPRAEGLDLGFFAAKSHEVVDEPSCVVLDRALRGALERIRGLLASWGEVCEVRGLSDGTRAMIGLQGIRPTDARCDEVTSLLDATLVGVMIRGHRERRALGRTYLELDADERFGPFRAHPFVFCQAHAGVNRALVREVVGRAAANGGGRIVELYAGAGNFTRGLRTVAADVRAFESDRDAIRLLEGLAETPGPEIRVRRERSKNVAEYLAQKGRPIDLIVLDPPRGGLEPGEAAALGRVRTSRILYVSCDPATLARDLAVLVEAKFRVSYVRVFDMMPYTSDVEVLVELSRDASPA